jgi:hypothetical protein
LKSLIKKILRETTLITEGPICGDKTGDACGNCGDGYVWTDSYVTNSCICNHPQGAVCHSTGMYGYGGTPALTPNTVKGYKGRPRLRESGPPGIVNITGTYKDVKPHYNFQSQGPMPGRVRGPGYDFESKGPEGVNYFMEEDGDEVNPWAICTSSLGLEGKKRKDYSQTEKNKYEKCVLSMKGKIEESNIEKLIKKTLRESRQLLKESCTCYTENPVSGGPMLVYDLCGQGTQAASCSCCCSAWLHPHYVEDQPCLTTMVVPSSGGDDELSLYADDFLTVDDTGNVGDGLDIERDIQRGDLIKKTKNYGFGDKAIHSLRLREQENIAATLYKQDTAHRDDDTGTVIASTQMLDIMNVKLDTLTDIVTEIQENLSRDWM